MAKLMMISADGHVNPRTSDYADLVEAKYRDGVASLIEETKIFVDNTWLVAKDAKTRAIVDPLNETEEACKEGVWNPHRRVADLEREGFVAEILFPGDPSSIGLYFMNTHSPFPAEYRAAGVRAYNRWLADFCNAVPGRLFGIAQTEPWPDFDACIKQIEQAKKDGMVGVAVPRYPGIEANQPPLTDPIWERFWAACADLDLTVSLHIGHLRPQGGMLEGMVQLNTRETGFVNPEAADGKVDYDPARRPFWQMVMSGVFDRYPNLRVTFSEIRTDWVAPTLAHLERRFDEMRFGGQASALPKLRPTDYWRRNCGAAHMMSPFDIALRYQTGVENMMFAVDYPHVEGSWPNSKEWLRLVLKGVPESEIRLILGENTARLYNMDVASLQPLVERFGLEPSDVIGDYSVADEYIDSFAFRSIFLDRPHKYDASEIEPLMDEDQAAVLQFAR